MVIAFAPDRVIGMIEEPRENKYEGKKSINRAIDKIQTSIKELISNKSDICSEIFIPYIHTDLKNMKDKQIDFIKENIE